MDEINNDIDVTEMVNDLLEVIAELFPEAYQKSKEAQLRREMGKVIKDYID